MLLFLSGDAFEDVFNDCLNEFEFDENAEKIPKFLIGICFGFIFNAIDFVGFIIFDVKYLLESSIFYCLFILKYKIKNLNIKN